MSILDQLYPSTGKSKVAEAAGAGGELDLSQITGEQMLALINDGTIVLQGGEEPGADNEPDLSNLSAIELAQLIHDGEQEKVAAAEEATLRAMMEDGSFYQADLAGRIMARAQMDEFSKLASADELPEELDVADLDAETFRALIESGEYEVEKVAAAGGFMDGLRGRAVGVALAARAGKAAAAAPGKAGKAAWDAARGGGGGKGAAAKDAAKAFLASKMGKAQAGGAAALAAGGAGAAAYKLRRKKK